MGSCGLHDQPALSSKDTSADAPGVEKPAQSQATSNVSPDAQGGSNLCPTGTVGKGTPGPASSSRPLGPSLQPVSPGAGASVITAKGTEGLHGVWT